MSTLAPPEQTLQKVSLFPQVLCCLFFRRSSLFLLAQLASGHNQRGEGLICSACGQPCPQGRWYSAGQDLCHQPCTNPPLTELNAVGPSIYALSNPILSSFFNLNSNKCVHTAAICECCRTIKIDPNLNCINNIIKQSVKTQIYVIKNIFFHQTTSGQQCSVEHKTLCFFLIIIIQAQYHHFLLLCQRNLLATWV